MSNSNPLLKGKVPARYIGEHGIVLSSAGKPYFDANGKPLQSLALRTGDTLYVNEGEARGESWWHDPRREKESLRMGTGRRVRAEHADLTAEEHAALGYEFHEKSAIWEEILSEGQTELPVQAADPAEITTLSAMVASMIESVKEAMPEDAEGV